MLRAGIELPSIKSPRALYALFVVLAVLGGIVLYYPLLDSGYLADDYLQHAMLDGRYQVPRSALDLYSFARSPAEVEILRDAGTLPWWTHTEWRASALRPLSSALTWFDHRVLKLSAYGRHVHSLLWLIALVVAYAHLARRLLPFGAACLALSIFAVDPTHLVPIWWLANRTALVSAAFGVAGISAYIGFREQGRRALLWLSGSMFALALAGGEYGLAALAYPLGYELFVGQGSLRQRLVALSAPAIPAAIFLVAFVALGCGAAASSWYVSPLSSPVDFTRHAALRLPVLLGSEFLKLPSEFAYLEVLSRPTRVLWLIPPLSIVGFLIHLTIRKSPPPLRGRLLFLLAGALLSLLPLIGAPPSARLLGLPSVGGSALIASVLWDGWNAFRQRASARKLALWSRLLMTALLASIHLGFAASESFRSAKVITHLMQDMRSVYLAAPIDDRLVAGQDLILLNASDPMFLLYVFRVRFAAGRPSPRVWRALSMTPRPIRVRRTDPQTLELSTTEGSLLEDPIAALVRSAEFRLWPGDHVELPRMRVDVLEATERGPQRVRFRFEQVLEDPSLELLVVAHGRLYRWTAPPVGGERWAPPPGG